MALMSENEMNLQWAIDASDLYQLLSIAFRYPAEDLAKGVADQSFSGDLCACLEGLGADKEETESIRRLLRQPGESDTIGLLDQMKIEYTRLFLAPKQELVRLYEGTFCFKKESGKKNPQNFMEPATLHVEQLYRKAGVVSVGHCREPVDHMSTEFEFMMFLYGKLAQAINGEDSEEIITRQEQLREFYEMHLRRWLYGFMEKVGDSTVNSIYKAFAAAGLLTYRLME